MRKSAKAALTLAIIGAGLALAWPIIAPNVQLNTIRLPAPLDAYPDRQALGEIAKWHLERTSNRGKKPKLILSWSLSYGTLNWEGILVDEDGLARSFRHLYGYSRRGGEIVAPGPRMQQLIDEIGPTSPSTPDLPEVLIVSFEKDGQWQTRLYDRRRLPKPLRRFIEYAFAHSGERMGEIIHE